MSGDPLYRNDEWLREQYHKLGKSQGEIAELADVTESTIRRWMRKYGIESRSMSEAKSEGDTDLYTDPEWLREQHWDQGRTLNEIGELAGVSGTTIKRWMGKLNIETRSNTEAQTDGDRELYTNSDWLQKQYWKQKRTVAEIGDLAGVSGTTIKRWMDRLDIETRSIPEAQTDGDIEPLKDPEWLEEQYWDREKTLAEIGSELGVTDVAVLSWMMRHGIERRDTTASEVQAEGDVEPLKNPEWLREQYAEKGLSAGEIGEKLGVSKTPVLKYMEEHGIKPRSIAERNSKGDVTPLRDAEWLREQYVEQELSQYEVADKLGVADVTVGNWMDRHGIDPRPAFERNSDGDIQPLRNEEWLREQYVEQSKSTVEIASELGVSTHPVRDYLREYNIEIRSNEFDPDHLPHRVRSSWELTVANLLRDAGVEYEYESLEIEYGNDRVYTPDFVTDDYVIEVKGRIYSNEVEKANAAINQLTDREYVVVGTELPADIHIRLEERAALHDLFE